MGRAGRALFRADVLIVDWPCNRCPDRSLELRTVRALGGSRAEKQRPAVSRRARLMFDHAYVGTPNRPLATIGF